jgi:hypothetical protein
MGHGAWEENRSHLPYCPLPARNRLNVLFYKQAARVVYMTLSQVLKQTNKQTNKQKLPLTQVG